MAALAAADLGGRSEKLGLFGHDGRTRGGRRFKALLASLSDELGGYRSLGEADKAAVRRAATVSLRLEQLEADIVGGKPVDSDELIRLSSESRRLLAGLKRSAPVKPAAGNSAFREYLASKTAGVQAA